MSVTAVRILLVLALQVFLFGLWYLLGIAADDLGGFGTVECLRIANLSCAPILIGVWWLTWRPVLPRGRRIGKWTALSAIPYLVAVAIAPWGAGHGIAVLDVLAYVTLPIASGIWLMATAWLFCARAPLSSAGFDLDRLACPSCGYSLVGLHEVRCPECGWRATIDQLFAHCAADPLA